MKNRIQSIYFLYGEQLLANFQTTAYLIYQFVVTEVVLRSRRRHREEYYHHGILMVIFSPDAPLFIHTVAKPGRKTRWPAH